MYYIETESKVFALTDIWHPIVYANFANRS
jgi:hypothetical protein